MAGILIGICDDQKEIAEKLQEDICVITKQWKCECETKIFYSGENLLKADMEFTAVFLDIEMRGIDGIETGRVLRNKQPECKIIMATGKENRYKEAFYIQAFRFITKPFCFSEIEEALSAILCTTIGKNIVEVYHRRIFYQFMQFEIKYTQSYDGYTEFIIGNQTFRKDMSLSDLEKNLEPRMFYRVQRRYIVNLKWIDEYRDGIVKIQDIHIQVPRRKRKEFEQKFIEFDIRYR